MAKAYWIAHVTVTDPDQYKDCMPATRRIAFKKYGSRTVLARGGCASEQVEGDGRPRNVVIEFPSLRRHVIATTQPNIKQRGAKTAWARARLDIAIVRGRLRFTFMILFKVDAKRCHLDEIQNVMHAVHSHELCSGWDQ